MLASKMGRKGSQPSLGNHLKSLIRTIETHRTHQRPVPVSLRQEAKKLVREINTAKTSLESARSCPARFSASTCSSGSSSGFSAHHLAKNKKKINESPKLPEEKNRSSMTKRLKKKYDSMCQKTLNRQRYIETLSPNI